MKKDNKLSIRKILFISRLMLVLMILFVIVRTVLLPKRIENSFAPAPPLRQDGVYVGKTTDTPVLSLENFADIIKTNPFGTSDQSGAGKEVSNNLTDSEGSVSQELGLALFGIVSGDPAIARAVIKDLKTGELNPYRLGQTVAGARIESIDTEAVILTHNGKRKTLRLYTARPGGGNYSTLTPSPRTIDEKNCTARTDLSPEQTDTSIAQAKPTALETILKKATIEPYTADGQIEGLRITGLEDLGIVKALGFRNGDVIRVVNGQRSTSRQKAFQILKKARTQAAISVELLRDNQTKELSFATK